VIKKQPTPAIYAVAFVFFVAASIVLSQLITEVAAPFGFKGVNVSNAAWVLPAFVIALCVVLYGVLLMTRLHPIPQGLLFAMTIYLIVQAIITPAGSSPFYSASRIYLNRALILLPMVASCVFLFRLRRRA